MEELDTILISELQESTLCPDEHGIKGNSDMVSEAPCRSEPSLWLRHSPSPGERPCSPGSAPAFLPPTLLPGHPALAASAAALEPSPGAHLTIP